MNRLLIATFAMLLTIAGGNLLAQETEESESATTENATSETDNETSAQSTDSQNSTEETDASNDVFDPSEDISEDYAVPYPTDI